MAYEVNMQLAFAFALNSGMDSGLPFREILMRMAEGATCMGFSAQEAWETALRVFDEKSGDLDTAKKQTLILEALEASQVFGRDVLITLSFVGLARDGFTPAIRYLSMIAGVNASERAE